MIRRIIKINEELCDGCGICAEACHEGAIAIINGKAQLIRDDYCDGLGDCLPACPPERSHLRKERPPHMTRKPLRQTEKRLRKIPFPADAPEAQSRAIDRGADLHASVPASEQPSCLSQWPVQIKLAPVNAPYFDNADLLIAADCTAYAYGAFHEKFIKGRITLIGCPKLDNTDYSEKTHSDNRSKQHPERQSNTYGSAVLRRY